jgi:hypothetical protein
MSTSHRSINSGEVYQAIMHLLEERGVYHASDNVVVSKVMTSTGQSLYVVMTKGIGCSVTDTIASVIAPKSPPGHETVVLSAHEVCELVRKGQRRFF